MHTQMTIKKEADGGTQYVWGLILMLVVVGVIVAFKGTYDEHQYMTRLETLETNDAALCAAFLGLAKHGGYKTNLKCKPAKP